MIIIKPEIGELAYVVTLPFLNDKKQPYIRHITGLIESIKKNKRYKIKEIDDWFPIYRIKSFGFGGIMLLNDHYNESRCYQEDKQYLRKLGFK